MPLHQNRLIYTSLACKDCGEKGRKKNEPRNIFHLFRAASTPAKLGTVLQQTLGNHASESNTALVSHAQRYRTESHTETSFWLTTKDSDQHTTPINVQSMAKTRRRQIQRKRESSKLDFSGPTSERVTLTELKCGFSCSCSNDFMVL